MLIGNVTFEPDDAMQNHEESQYICVSACQPERRARETVTREWLANLKVERLFWECPHRYTVGRWALRVGMVKSRYHVAIILACQTA